jgi:hypothetical protein
MSDPGVAAGETGSSAESSPAPPPNLICPHCGFGARDEFGLRVHMGKKHRGEPLPEFVDAPTGGERPAPPKPPKPIRTPAQLEQIRAQFEVSLQALGGVLVLFGRVVTGLAIQRRAGPLAARAVAWGATNEGVMRAVLLVNGLFQGGELGQLLAPIVVAAAYDLGVVRPDRQLGPISGVALLSLIDPELEEAHRLHQAAERAMAQAHPDGTQSDAA